MLEFCFNRGNVEFQRLKLGDDQELGLNGGKRIEF